MVFGVQPEDLTVGTESVTAAENAVVVELEGVEALGDSSMLHCFLTTGESIVVRSPLRQDFRPATQPELAYDPARLRLFDPDNATAIYRGAGPPS